MLVQSGCPTLDWPAAPPKSLLINLSHSMTQKVDLEQSQSSRSFVLLKMSIGASAGGDLTVQDCRQQLAIGQVRYESDFNKRPVFLIYRIHIAYYILFIKSCYRVDVGTSNWSLGKQTKKHNNKFFSLFFFSQFFHSWTFKNYDFNLTSILCIVQLVLYWFNQIHSTKILLAIIWIINTVWDWLGRQCSSHHIEWLNSHCLEFNLIRPNISVLCPKRKSSGIISWLWSRELLC